MISTFSVRAGDFVQQPIGALMIDDDKDVKQVVVTLAFMWASADETLASFMLHAPNDDLVWNVLDNTVCRDKPISTVRAGVIEWKRLRGIAP